MKRLVVCLALFSAAWPLSQASAGSYEVFACGGAAGSAQNAFTAVADPGLAAYASCPNTPSNPASGVVTRASATSGPGTVPLFAGASQNFEAPPGASLASVTLDLSVIRLASYWTVGIVTYDPSFSWRTYGCFAGIAGCSIGLPSFYGPVTVGLGGHSAFRLETRCGNPGGCDISGSGFTPGMRALFSAANIRVRVEDFTKPAITPHSGALWNEAWHRGREQAWERVTDNVGIARLRLIVDGVDREIQDFTDPMWDPGVRCDFTLRRPCNDVTGGLTLDTGALSDGRHSMRVEAVDAAGNSSSLERVIDVDNTAPARVNASVEGESGWRRWNGFTVRWPQPAAQVSPIAAAHYEICTAGQVRRCSSGTRSGTGVGALTDVQVPADGEYTLRVWLEDAAGNASGSAASDPVRLRLDSSPPEQVAFAPTNRQDPRRVEVVASDAVSGIADGSIEMRQVGRRQWHELSTGLSSGGISAYVDDLDLPDGKYEVRARVTDAAGNERVGDRSVDGSKSELSLPLRARSRISLRTTRRGAKRWVHGRLAVDGTPLGGRSIAVHEQARTASSFHQAAALRTDDRGRFRYRLRYGPTRTIRFRYEGTSLIKPSIESLALKVPARTAITTRRSYLRNGQSAEFRGRLRGLPPPEGGKLIDLQAYYRDSWRTFATPRTDAAGRWSFRYRFEATRGLVKYRFRARIRRETAYPYELGYSGVVTVTVRG